jgi:pimeloyl-ACP methyl ester carboxylesterase
MLIDPGNQVVSKDGTPIAFQRSGNGSPLILVHGTGADHTRWSAVLPLLTPTFTVYALDRRGRGGSGDASNYAVEREFEDVAAVAASIDGPVDILGHSFGAACVLGAAPRIPNLRRLIAYEPPMLHEQQTPARDGLLERMDQALAQGDREAVLIIMMTEMLKIPLPAIERVRSMPTWADSLASAHTIPRELRASDVYGSDEVALKNIKASTLFLLGGDSLDSFKVTTETLHGLLPQSQIILLPDQQHSAMLTAPALFASAVVQFLSA